MQKDINIFLENVACRILVISHTVNMAQSCINRIQNLGNKPPPDPLNTTPDVTTSVSDVSGSSSDLLKTSWTISNKYYSAPVHFAIHTVHGLSPHHCRNVPAVIYVWSKGQSYKRQIERIAQDLSGSEPEVCLAIRTTSYASPASTHAADEDEQNEDDGEVDAFLTSFGFEFIDGTDEEASNTEEGVSEADNGSQADGIPRLPRVLDALSTIMWPSMQPTTKISSSSTRTRDREQILLDWAHDPQDSGSLAIEESADNPSRQSSTRTRSMKHEMEELARWLEDDVRFHDDPWRSAATSGEIVASPTSIEPGDEDRPGKTDFMGFDDDFTVFVSAPAVEHNIATSARSSPNLSITGLSPASAIPSAGPLYRSLGSVSDFGDSEDEKNGDDNDSVDDDLPTKDEILAASSRIFGPSRSNADAFDEMPIVGGLETKDLSSPSKVASDVESAGGGEMDGDGDGSYDMEPFDLSKVVNALQEMKAEIASMEDEGERRKAAAKVALGLVYGLEADAHTL